jgi:hypothetical protein
MMFLYKHIADRTANFTRNPETFTDGELLKMWQPDDLFFMELQKSIPTLHPQQAAQVRKNYAYIQHLYILQGMAWHRLMQRYEAEAETLANEIEKLKAQIQNEIRP